MPTDPLELVRLSLGTGLESAEPGFNPFLGPYVTVRSYPMEVGLQRLVDLDRRCRGEATLFIPELNSVDPRTAADLHRDGVHAGLGDLAVMPQGVAKVKAARIVAFCASRKSLAGLESLFVSSLSFVQQPGTEDVFSHGLRVAQEAGPLPHLSGAGLGCMLLAAGNRQLVGLSLPAVNAMLGYGDESARLAPGKDISTVAMGAAGASPLDNKICEAGVVGVSTAAGQAVGAIYGAPVGAAIGAGVGGGVPGAIVGAVIGGRAGPMVGAAMGTVAGLIASDAICGGTTNETQANPTVTTTTTGETTTTTTTTTTTSTTTTITTSTSTAPTTTTTPAPAPGAPAPAPAAPAPTPTETAPPVSEAEEQEHPNAEVTTTVNPRFDANPPGPARDPRDPSDSEGCGVARCTTNFKLPPHTLEKILSAGNGYGGNLSGLPRVRDSGIGSFEVDWGDMAPYVNPGRDPFRTWGPAPADDRRGGLDPRVINPPRNPR